MYGLNDETLNPGVLKLVLQNEVYAILFSSKFHSSHYFKNITLLTLKISRNGCFLCNLKMYEMVITSRKLLEMCEKNT